MRRHISLLVVLFFALTSALFAQVPLVITTSSPLPTATVGVNYSLQLAGVGGTQPYSWYWYPASEIGFLPPDLSLDYATGLISGIPSAAGTYSVVVTLSDWYENSVTKTFQLTINPPAPLTITSISPNHTTAGTGKFTLTVTGTGFFDQTSMVHWGQSELPTTFDSTTQLRATVAESLISQPGFPNVQVIDLEMQRTSNAWQFRVYAQPAITTTSLPGGTVGTPYSEPIQYTCPNASCTWSMPSGTMPPGLELIVNGSVRGTPTQAGTFTFAVRVTDSAGVSATAEITLTVIATPAITTDSQLPNGTVGVAYPPQTFAAAGGTPAYTWTAQTSALPPGLTVSTAGVLSGTPTQAGTSTFTVTVTDSAQGTASKQFTLTVAAPPAPAPSVTLSSTNPGPAQQPTLNVQLSAPYALQMTGVLTLTFAPDAVASADDPAIQFSAGGRTLPFTIPAGQTSAFSTPPALSSTGTVAGTITLTITQLVAGGQSVLPSPAPIQTVTVARSVPVITSVQVSKVSPGFSVLIRGYSTPRQMTQATFIFTGTNLQGASAVIQLDIPFGAWYAGSSSTPFGSQFLYTQPFTIQGDISAITSVSVTLQNSSGSSQAVSANF